MLTMQTLQGVDTTAIHNGTTENPSKLLLSHTFPYLTFGEVVVDNG